MSTKPKPDPKPKAKRLVWAREPHPDMTSMRGWDLRAAGEVVARVRPLYRRPGFRDGSQDLAGWYWYGFSQNTSATPTKTPELAMKHALAHARRLRKEGKL